MCVPCARSVTQESMYCMCFHHARGSHLSVSISKMICSMFVACTTSPARILFRPVTRAFGHRAPGFHETVLTHKIVGVSFDFWARPRTSICMRCNVLSLAFCVESAPPPAQCLIFLGNKALTFAPHRRTRTTTSKSTLCVKNGGSRVDLATDARS